MDILYERTKGEKKLLTIINATVSHEMRNPINSIQALNIKQGQINNRLRLVIDKIDSNMAPDELKEKLTAIHDETEDIKKINSSSSKILCFLVNDILDYA